MGKVTTKRAAINLRSLGGPPRFQAGDPMRELLRSERFWTVLITVCVPFGWIFPLLRLAYRTVSR